MRGRGRPKEPCCRALRLTSAALFERGANRRLQQATGYQEKATVPGFKFPVFGQLP